MISVRWLPMLACTACLCACEVGEPPCGPTSANAALTNAAARAEYLMLEPSEEAAVADLRINPGTPNEGRCTGALIAPRAVLTAKHCTQGSPAPLRVAFGPDGDGRSFETEAEVDAVHPIADVMVVKLAESPSEAIEVVPLRIARELPRGVAIGSLVQLAGYGEDEDGEIGARAFLVEPVLELREDAIVVGTNGLSGACFGDSGGPLLVRGPDGHASIAGVLRRGSVGCFGRDAYTRLDSVAAWLVDLELDTGDNDDLDHRTLGSEGRCFDDMAVWAEDGELRASTCEENRRCGWSARARGYRCVARDRDPCEGISDVGTCEDDDLAVRCVRGALEYASCAACGLTCVRSPTTGLPACSIAPQLER